MSLDKVQKELTKIYYHARMNMVGEHGGGRLKELVWGVENGFVDINHPSVYNNSAEILFYYPHLIDKLNLNKMDIRDIHKILQRQPQLIDHEYFKEKIKSLEGLHVAAILTVQDQLINKFDITKLNNKDIGFILRYKPHLWKYFKDKFKKFNEDEMGELLYNKPELIDVYNWDFSKWDDTMFSEFFNIHPDYKRHKRMRKYWKALYNKYMDA